MQVNVEWMGGPDDGDFVKLDNRTQYLYVPVPESPFLLEYKEEVVKLPKRKTYAVPIEIVRGRPRLMWHKKVLYESGPL